MVGPAYVQEAYKLEPEVTEEVAGEAMKEASFGCHRWTRGGSSHGQSCEIIPWWLDNEGATTVAKLLNADDLTPDGPTGHADMNDMSGLGIGWNLSLAASAAPHTPTPLLDKMCTHSVDLQERKPKTFRADGADV